MKSAPFIIILFLGTLALAGCTNPDGTQDNRATGALVGAGVGAAVGGQQDRHAAGL